MHTAPNPLLARLIEAVRKSADDTTALLAPQLGEISADWARLERALKRQEIAEEAAHVGTFEADLATGEISFSREVARLHGGDPEVLVLSLREFFSAVSDEDRATLASLAGRRDDFTVDYRYRCRDGSGHRILEISGRWLPGERPDHPGYYIGVERDVTAQRAQEEQLRQLALHDPLTGALNRRGFEQLLTRHAATHAVPGAGCLLMIDLDDFKHHNDAYGHAVGDAILIAIADAVQGRLGRRDAIGRLGGDEFVVLLPDRTTSQATKVADDLVAVIAGAAQQVSPDPLHPVTASIGVAALIDDDDPTVALRRADEAMYNAKSRGGGHSARWTKHPLPATTRVLADAAPIGALGPDDIDPVTGILHLRALWRLLEERLARAEASDSPGMLTAFFITIYGTELLDQETARTAYTLVVRSIADRLKQVDGDGLVGLLGVAQVVGVVTVRDEAERDAIAAQVACWVREPFAVEEMASTVMPLVATASWSPGISASTLLQNATIATNVARYDGPGAIRHFDEDLMAWAMERATTHVALRRALDQREFQLDYQPVLDIRTGAFNRVEALVRWRPASGRTIGPNLFIPVAEATGLILPLGEQIIEIAIAQARAWCQQGRYARISVNLSAVELTTPGFAESLLARLQASRLGPSWFTFEVTESALMDNLEVARAGLQRLYDAGYRVVLDDFGTGHSSLARLGEIPTSGIKIDMALVRRLTTDPAARTVVGAIIDIGRAYGATVIAEGIEDAATLEIVRELGVDFAQGYHLGRPQPADELTDLLPPRRAESMSHLVESPEDPRSMTG